MRDDIFELIENEEYELVREELEKCNYADAAELIEDSPEEKTLEIFKLLTEEMAPSVFSFLPTETQGRIIVNLSADDAGRMIDELYADDVADLMEEVPSALRNRILAYASSDIKKSVYELMQYPPESAGSLMTVEYVALKETWTLEEALAYIRSSEAEQITIDACYVLTDLGELAGVISLRKLVISPPEETLKSIMRTDPVMVHVMDDQEEVADKFQKYNLSILPVVDDMEHMVGIITVDDIIDVMEQETTEDMQKMAAMLPGDKPYMKSSVWEQVKKRLPWLLLLMLSATFTGAIITSFEEKLSQCIALTAYIPMLMDSGGNAGGQSSTTIIRAISLNEVKFRDTFRVIWKEARIAVCCGIALAVVNFVKMMLLDRVGIIIAVVVSSTLVVAVLCAKMVGCVLPIVAKKIGLDPAVMANPLITTIVDAISLLVYFWFASWMMGF